MDACDPRIDIKNLKKLVKQNTGAELNLTREQICNAYSAIQANKLPLPPLVLSRDGMYMTDRKSPLTPNDFEILFSSSSTSSQLKRVARKAGLSKFDKMTKADIIESVEGILKSKNVHEPIKLHVRPPTKSMRRVSVNNNNNNYPNNLNVNNVNKNGVRNNNNENKTLGNISRESQSLGNRNQNGNRNRNENKNGNGNGNGNRNRNRNGNGNRNTEPRKTGSYYEAAVRERARENNATRRGRENNRFKTLVGALGRNRRPNTNNRLAQMVKRVGSSNKPATKSTEELKRETIEKLVQFQAKRAKGLNSDPAVKVEFLKESAKHIQRVKDGNIYNSQAMANISRNFDRYEQKALARKGTAESQIKTIKESYVNSLNNKTIKERASSILNSRGVSGLKILKQLKELDEKLKGLSENNKKKYLNGFKTKSSNNIQSIINEINARKRTANVATQTNNGNQRNAANNTNNSSGTSTNSGTQNGNVNNTKNPSGVSTNNNNQAPTSQQNKNKNKPPTSQQNKNKNKPPTSQQNKNKNKPPTSQQNNNQPPMSFNNIINGKLNSFKNPSSVSKNNNNQPPMSFNNIINGKLNSFNNTSSSQQNKRTKTNENAIKRQISEAVRQAKNEARITIEKIKNQAKASKEEETQKVKELQKKLAERTNLTPNEVAKLQNQINNAKSKAKNVESKANARVKAVQNAAQESIIALRERANKEIANAKAQANAATKAAERAEQNALKFKQNINNYRRTVVSNASKIERLETKLKNSNLTRQERNSLRNQLNLLKNNLVSAQRQLEFTEGKLIAEKENALREQREKQNALMTELNKQKKNINNYRRTVVSNASKIERLESKLKNSNLTRQERNSLRNQLNLLKNNLVSAQRQLEFTEGKLIAEKENALRKQEENYQKRIQKLTQNLSRELNKVKLAKTQKQQNDKIIANLKKQIEKATEKIAFANDQFKKQTEIIQRSSQEIKNLTGELQGVMGKKSEALQELKNKHQKNMMAYIARIKKLTFNVQTRNEQIANLQERVRKSGATSLWKGAAAKGLSKELIKTRQNLANIKSQNIVPPQTISKTINAVNNNIRKLQTPPTRVNKKAVWNKSKFGTLRTNTKEVINYGNPSRPTFRGTTATGTSALQNVTKTTGNMRTKLTEKEKKNASKSKINALKHIGIKDKLMYKRRINSGKNHTMILKNATNRNKKLMLQKVLTRL
jgi:hypothetical protein